MSTRKKPITNDELEIGLHFELEKSSELRSEIFSVLRDIESTLDHFDEYKKSGHFKDITFEKFIYAATEQESLGGSKRVGANIAAAASVFNFHIARSRPSATTTEVSKRKEGATSPSTHDVAKVKLGKSNASVSRPQICSMEEIIERIRHYQEGLDEEAATEDISVA